MKDFESAATVKVRRDLHLKTYLQVPCRTCHATAGCRCAPVKDHLVQADLAHSSRIVTALSRIGIRHSRAGR